MDSFEFLMGRCVSASTIARVDASRPAQDIERSPFAEKSSRFLIDLSGERLREFVCAIWNFCTMDDADVVSFAFGGRDRNPVTRGGGSSRRVWTWPNRIRCGDTGLQDVKCSSTTHYEKWKVTERDWTKWTQHNPGSPAVD